MDLVSIGIALFFVLIAVFFLSGSKQKPPQTPKPAEPTAQKPPAKARAPRTFTLEELSRYNSTNPPSVNDEPRFLVSVVGKVYDLSEHAGVYAKGGSYDLFPGHDVTYCFANGALDRSCLDLHPGKMTGAKQHNIDHFVSKWEQRGDPCIGTLVNYPDCLKKKPAVRAAAASAAAAPVAEPTAAKEEPKKSSPLAAASPKAAPVEEAKPSTAASAAPVQPVQKATEAGSATTAAPVSSASTADSEGAVYQKDTVAKKSPKAASPAVETRATAPEDERETPAATAKVSDEDEPQESPAVSQVGELDADEDEPAAAAAKAQADSPAAAARGMDQSWFVVGDADASAVAKPADSLDAATGSADVVTPAIPAEVAASSPAAPVATPASSSATPADVAPEETSEGAADSSSDDDSSDDDVDDAGASARRRRRVA